MNEPIVWLTEHKAQVITILIVVAIGLVIINQWMDFNFKIQLLEEPCALCQDKGYICSKPSLTTRLVGSVYFNFNESTTPEVCEDRFLECMNQDPNKFK
jgi:hypothetical protein